MNNLATLKTLDDGYEAMLSMGKLSGALQYYYERCLSLNWNLLAKD